MIQSAASAASARGGCASSRLDHGLKVELDPYIKGPKRQFFIYFFIIVLVIFWNYTGLGAANKSAASAASPDYVENPFGASYIGIKLNFQAVIKLAASAASLRGGCASGRLDHGLFFIITGRALTHE